MLLEISNITYFFPVELLINYDLVPEIKTPLTAVAPVVVESLLLNSFKEGF